jgi:ParB family transcriptional regulator, chromosome partitioning protein
LKKGDMAVEAERLLADSNWLPEPLRTPEIDAGSNLTSAAVDAEAEVLPAFLAADGEFDEGAREESGANSTHILAAE